MERSPHYVSFSLTLTASARLDGRLIGVGAALARWFVLFFELLFMGIPLYRAIKTSALHQRNGDRFAGTVVVRADATSPRGPGASSKARQGAGAAAGLVVAAQAAFVLWWYLTAR